MNAPFPLLSAMTFSPLVGVPLIVALKEAQRPLAKWIALLSTLVPLTLGVPLALGFDHRLVGVDSIRSFQFVESWYWMPSFHVFYKLGIDGLSLALVLLTVLLCPLCILASFRIERAEKAYFSLFLLLETGMIGSFVALDLVLFYVFWELMLLPMYFLIGIWGGPRRVYAAIKFFLYTLAGSLGLLLGILALYFASSADPGARTFDLLELIRRHDVLAAARPIFGWLPFAPAIWWAFFIGFAIKVPVVPFHTWLPDAHVEAPTAISVILAGVLLKMGTYGFYRFNVPLFPEYSGAIAQVVVVLGVINILYGALCAMAQSDLKRLVAYSSISHMGFVLLGLGSMTTQGLTGGLFQMFNHGTITAMLFLLVGVIYDRAHHRQIDGFGGLANAMPLYTAFTGFAFFAALGLPALSSFVSELLCLLGGFLAFPVWAVLGAIGVILGAAYLLWTMQRMFFGELNEKYRSIDDINAREIVSLVPLAVIVVYLGVRPMLLLDTYHAAAARLAQLAGRAVETAAALAP